MSSWWQQLKYELDQRGVWASFRNRNEGPDGEPKGPAYEGRATLHLGDALHVLTEWNLFGRFFHVEAGTDPMEGELRASVGLGPTVWLIVGGKPIRRLLKLAGLDHWRSAKQISLSAHDGSIWWKLGVDPDSWSSSRPRWRDGNFGVLDFLLGKQQHTVLHAQEPVTVRVPMLDGSYEARVTITEDQWRRPRWFAKRGRFAEVDIPKGIPFSGKGENSWDCGDDALFGLSCEARNVAEAVGKVVGSVLETRTRRGDPWLWPTKTAEAVE